MKLIFRTDDSSISFNVTEEIIKKFGSIYASSHYNKLEDDGEINCTVSIESKYSHILIHSMMSYAKNDKLEIII